MFSSALIGLFVSRLSRIMQKLLVLFLKNSVERWHMDQGRND